MRPYKVLVFIVSCFAVLALMCVVLPHRITVGDRTLKWPTLAEVIGEEAEELTDLSDLSDPSDPSDTSDTIPADTVAIEEPQPQKPVLPRVVVDSTTDTRLFLASFYVALQHSSEQRVRVVHYGDSQIEEDRMTTQIRQRLQDRFGGSGAGLMPLAQTIPSLTVSQELIMNGRTITPQQGPRRYMVYALKRDQRNDGMYGPMGQVAVMNDSLVSGSEDITAVCTPQDGHTQYTRWQILADSTISYDINGDTIHLYGRGSVYGLSQESETGVIVDNIPMRGSLGLVFNKIDTTQLRTFYADNNVRLIIMQFGGNAIPYTEKPGTIQSIVRSLRRQVRYLRMCAPEASILFIGPSDMLTFIDGEPQTYPMIPYMDQLLRKMAQEEQIGYFSLFRWMGGEGSMAHWQEIGLAGKDGIHFMRSGARKAGNAVANWILEGIDLSNDQRPTTNDEPL